MAKAYVLPEEIYRNKAAFYVFDVCTLKERIAWLRSLLPKETALCYAVKANPFLAAAAEGEVERLEVCSPGEANLCRELKIPAKKTVISGVYKTPEFIEELAADAAYDCIYTVESAKQFQLLQACGKNTKKRLPVLLRITNGSQFGLEEALAEEIIRDRKNYPELEILGIQYFSGTQKTSLKKWKREIEYLDELLVRWKEELGFEAEELEYGPGLPAVYFAEDEIDEEALLTGFSELLTKMKSPARVILELGRGMAYTCGKYYTHVVDKKKNHGQTYLLVDGGMHQIVYYGQVMAMKTPKLSVLGKGQEQDICVQGQTDAKKDPVVPKQPDPDTECVSVCGALCSMNDILVKQKILPKAAPGDILCFENTGAYCVTEGSALFLSRELPAVYLRMENGGFTLVREAVETWRLNFGSETIC